MTSSSTFGELQFVRLPRAQRAARAIWSLAERYPVRASFLVAVAVRVVAAIAITLVKGYLFGDESEYVTMGRLAAAGHLTPALWSGYGEALFHAAASFMWPIVVLFKLFGAHSLVAALWAGLFGAVTAALTAVIVGRALGRGWAALAGLTVAVFPSQIVWSSVVLRESMVWAGLAGAAVGISIFSRAKQLAIACWRHALGRGQPPFARVPSLLGFPAGRVGSSAWRCGCSARPARRSRGPCALFCACSSHWPQASVLRATVTSVTTASNSVTSAACSPKVPNPPSSTRRSLRPKERRRRRPRPRPRLSP